MASTIPDDAPRPRLCHVRKWEDFNGYGFNLHAEKGKAGQYIGKVDPGSPADLAGMKEGDRIVEVNGTNISNENHQQVVQRVKAVPNETRMLVVDAATEEYYRNLKVVVRGDMPNVDSRSTPERNPNSNVGDVVENNISDRSSNADDQEINKDSPTPPPPADEIKEQVTEHHDDGSDHPHRPRLCHIKIWPDFQGYGFNLHAEKNKPGQFIGKVDDGSPSEAAGLRQNDRIIEVNGQNVVNENHQTVVTLIKSVPNNTKLLVIDPVGDEYFKERNIVITGDSHLVERRECPDSRPAGGIVHAAVVDNIAEGSHPHKARLIQLATWSDYNGYGFNMHSIKGKEGEYIGKVETGSPAFVGGLKEGDRVIEVGGDNVETASHHDVVSKIKDANGRASMLVIDSEADAYFKSRGIKVNGDMSDVTVHVCPEAKPTANGTSDGVTSQVTSYAVASTTKDEVSLEAEKIADSIMASALEAERSMDAKEVHVEKEVHVPTPTPAPAATTPQSPKAPVVVGGIEFAGSAEEARRRMTTKKRDISRELSAKEKYDLFQRL